jgi:hypothetical protein
LNSHRVRKGKNEFEGEREMQREREREREREKEKEKEKEKESNQVNTQVNTGQDDRTDRELRIYKWLRDVCTVFVQHRDREKMTQGKKVLLLYCIIFF